MNNQTQKIQIRLKQSSKFNNGNLNNLPHVFQCRKCKKYNNVISPSTGYSWLHFQMYENVGVEEVRANLLDFIRQIAPVAESHGVFLAIHPDFTKSHFNFIMIQDCQSMKPKHQIARKKKLKYVNRQQQKPVKRKGQIARKKEAEAREQAAAEAREKERAYRKKKKLKRVKGVKCSYRKEKGAEKRNALF